MFALLDLPTSQTHWQRRAACRGADIDMVPGALDKADDHGTAEEIALAKKLCQFCPVRDDCLPEGEGERGIWGGLSFPERERLRTDPQRPVVACAACGLDCVPLDPEVSRCDGCRDSRQLPTPADYRREITEMVLAGAYYREIADRFGLARSAVASACRRWGFRSRAGKRAGGPDLRPCGTPAARVRHRRAGADGNGVPTVLPVAVWTIRNGVPFPQMVPLRLPSSWWTCGCRREIPDLLARPQRPAAAVTSEHDQELMAA